MLVIRNQQMKQLAKSAPGRRVVQPCPDTKTWVEIRLVDEEDQPVPAARYRLQLPDFTIIEGSLDDRGLARVDDIVPGACKVTFPEIDGREWRPV